MVPIPTTLPPRLQVLLDAGVAHHEADHVQRRVRLFNGLVLILAGGTCTGVPILIGFLPGVSAFLLLLTLMHARSYFLNSRGRFNLARLSLLSTMAVGVTGTGFLVGPENGVQVAGLILAGTPMLFLDRSEWKLLGAAITVPVMAYLVPTLAADLGLYPSSEIPGLGRAVIHLTLALNLVGILIGTILWFVVLQERAERALEERNHSMRVIFDHVHDALVTVDRSGRLVGESSGCLLTWFGPVGEDDTLGSYLARTFPVEGDLVGLVFETLADGAMPEKVVLAQLPERLRKDGRTWTLVLRPVGRVNQSERFLVVITEITEALEQERGSQVQRALVSAFVAFRRDPHGVRAFVAEADALVERLDESELTDPGLWRAVHTLKASTAAYGMTDLAELCHAAETAIIEGQATRADLGPLLSLWHDTRSALEPFLAKRSQRVTEDELAALLRTATREGNRLSLGELTALANLEPVRLRLEASRRLLRGTARRLGLPAPTVLLLDGGVRHEPERWGPFWTSLSHVLRNAVSHGLEGEAERAALGKRPAGRIVLDARVQDGEYLVSVSDDGHGIDWEALRDRAIASGLPAASDADLEAALFADGVSTADRLDDLAGRGLGLAAVREATVALGGRITVRSMPGLGTRFRFHFPASTVVCVGPAGFEVVGGEASNSPFEVEDVQAS